MIALRLYKEHLFTDYRAINDEGRRIDLHGYLAAGEKYSRNIDTKSIKSPSKSMPPLGSLSVYILYVKMLYTKRRLLQYKLLN